MMPTRICYPFAGNVVGGSHISARGLIARLDRSRFEPQVLLQHYRGPIASLMLEAGIPIEKAPHTAELEHGRPVGISGALGLAAAAPRLARFLRKRSIDIVHCNDGRTLATWAVAARLAGCKLLWHHRGSPDAAGLRLLAPAIADKVVAVSRFASPRPGWYSAAPRTSVIPSPFDTDISVNRSAARKAVAALLPKATSAARIVAFSGALIDRKRPQLFVEAIAAMHRRAPELNIRGVLFGESFDGMMETTHVRAAMLGIEDRIHFMGYRTPGPFWLAGCDLLMVPAIDEPFGRTLIEAMLVSTPVVATASGGNIEAIVDGRTGVLVRPEDSEALAAGCLALLADPARCARIGAAARAHAETRYGEQRHADAVMDVYEDMMTPPVERHAPPLQWSKALSGEQGL
jgi:glycosyltransferase involved in cell wall biosynthesis